jgi:hypothetical protein
MGWGAGRGERGGEEIVTHLSLRIK